MKTWKRMTPEERATFVKERASRMEKMYPYGCAPDILFFLFCIFYLRWSLLGSFGATVLTSALVHNLIFEWRYPKERSSFGVPDHDDRDRQQPDDPAP